MYKPLKVELMEFAGLYPSLCAMRLPKGSKLDSIVRDGFVFSLGKKDKKLARNLIKAGTDHAKFTRGIEVWLRMEFQVGWMVELVTYRIGTEDLSTSSTMHGNLRGMKGEALANKKQQDLPGLVYERVEKFSYQTLRAIYLARRGHRHPDWQILCDFIETLPHFNDLINP